jgi:hypothetical protein
MPSCSSSTQPRIFDYEDDDEDEDDLVAPRTLQEICIFPSDYCQWPGIHT